MTLLFIDGFDHYGDTDETQPVDKGYTTGNSAWWDITTSGARFGYGRCLKIVDYDGWFRRNLGVNKSTIYFGGAFKATGPFSYQTTRPLLIFEDESLVGQVKFHILVDKTIQVRQGDDTLLGTSTATIKESYWQYLEFKVTISATVGVIEVKLNGTQILNLTSQDTKNGSDYIRNILFRNAHNPDGYWDDIYIDDAQFHGDCRIKTFLPDSISTTNNSFTASAGNKDDCVNEAVSNNDTDYIYSDTLNHKQGFGITTGTLGTVIGIQLNNHCRVDAGGDRKIKPLIRSNGSDYLGTETDLIPDDFKFESEVWETDPDDSNSWTQTKLEAAEFGLEITT